MPACPRDKEYSPLSPATTLNENESSAKQNQLIDDLMKLVEKYRLDQQLVDQQPKQTVLLLSITRFVLATESIANEDRRNLLRTIISTSTDLLTENEQIETPSPVSIPISSMEDDDEGDFSLDDLAKEYTRDDPSPADKVTPPSEIDELKATTKADSATSVVLSAIFLPPPPSKSPLDSILFSNCLSSQAAADEADSIWKDTSSSFGQIFCTKTADTELKATQRNSSCLLDRSLYERLTRLIDLLPKQCPINSAPSISMRPAKGPSFSSNNNSNNNNVRPTREHRPNPNRPNFRAEFQPSMPMEQPRHRHPRPPAAGGFQTFNNSNYATNYAHEPQGYHHQPPNRHPHPPRAQGANDYFYSQRDPQRNDPRPRQPNRRNHFDNQQDPNQPQQQQQQQQQQGRRGPRNNNNNNNGPKFSHDKSGQNRPAPPK